jgi:tryptophan-rich sensory protein
MVTLSLFVAAAFYATIVILPAMMHRFKTTFYDSKVADKSDKRSRYYLPGWVFTIIWSVIYSLITAAQIVHISLKFSVSEVMTANQIALMSLFVINVFLNHFWSYLFFDWLMFWAAFVDIALAFGSAVTILVFYNLTTSTVAFWLYIAYPVWLFIAMILNLIWAITWRNSATEKYLFKGDLRTVRDRIKGTSEGFERM